MHYRRGVPVAPRPVAPRPTSVVDGPVDDLRGVRGVGPIWRGAPEDAEVGLDAPRPAVAVRRRVEALAHVPRRRRHGWCWWWCGPTVAPLRRAVVGFPVAESEQGVDVATMLRVQGADRLRVVRPRWHEGADLLERAERRRAPGEHHLGVRRPRVELAAIDHGGNPGIVQPVIRSVQDRGTPGRRVHVVSVVRAQWDSAQSHPARSQDHPLAAIASPWRVAGTHALRAQPVERAVEVGVARLHGADGKGCPRRAHQRQRRQLRQRATETVRRQQTRQGRVGRPPRRCPL